MSSRRKFSPEFKAEAIELVISSGRPVVQVAAEIGVNERTWGIGCGSGRTNILDDFLLVSRPNEYVSLIGAH